jgi:hypothetical protein
METMRPLKERIFGENDGLEAVDLDWGWSKIKQVKQATRTGMRST